MFAVEDALILIQLPATSQLSLEKACVTCLVEGKGGDKRPKVS